MRHRLLDEKESVLQSLLSVQNISKHFGNIHALRNVSLDISPKKIIGLAGENGAGKSTLVRIICGAIPCDSGEMKYQGRPYKPHDVSDAESLGISVFHQEIPICPHLSIAANVFLGPTIPSLRIRPDWKFMNNRCIELYKKFLDEDIDPTIPIGECSAAEQQLALLVRVLSRNAKLVILDEPTTALSAPEVERLFDSIKRLRDEQGIGFIFVSHLLDELMELSDEVFVLRDGENVGHLYKAEFSAKELSRLIAGRSIDVQHSSAKGFAEAEITLEARSISLSKSYEDISFSVHKGEVFGIAGLQGSGRSEVISSLFGLPPPDKGSVIIQGNDLGRITISKAITAGVGYLPEDRKTKGIFPDLNIAKNIGIVSIAQSRDLTSYNEEEYIELVDTMASKLSIKISNPKDYISTLSGGNQQKAMLARWLALSPSILVLNEPTRGVDIGAKSEIAKIISDMAEAGCTIIIASSEMEELLLMCDRIMVMNRGRARIILEKESLTRENLFFYAMS